MPPVTVMIEAAVLVGSAAALAVMTAVPFFCVAVTRPVVETVATVWSELVNVTAVFVEPLTAVTSCTVPPTLTVAAVGATVIVTTGGGGAAVTVTIAAACLLWKRVVAMIVVVPGVSAVTRPVVELTDATAGFVDENVAPPAEARLVSFRTCATNVAV
jgi:hypothetical protein